MTSQQMPPPRRPWRIARGAVLLTLGLVAATYPVWRVALLGSEPTLEELMRLTCSATGPAGPPAWLVRRGAIGGVAASDGQASGTAGAESQKDGVAFQVD